MTEVVTLPETLDSQSLAEWIELVILVDQVNDFSITEMLALFPSGQRPPVQDIEMALSVIEDRAAAAPTLYPLRRQGDRVVRAGHSDSGAEAVDECIYLFLKVACLQYAPWAQQRRADLVGSLFDYPVCEAMMSWLGEGSQGLIFGWPPRGSRPTQLVDAVSWLADRLRLPDGDLDRPPDGKDGGVDCVVWKPPHDERSGYPIWLVQASVEHNVVDKAAQVIPLEAWKRWIKFGAGPTTVFATAHSIPRGSSAWMDLNDAAVQLADRDRILYYLDKAQLGSRPRDWYRPLCEFVCTQMVLIRNPTGDEPVPRIRRRKRERTTEHADPRAR